MFSPCFQGGIAGIGASAGLPDGAGGGASAAAGAGAGASAAAVPALSAGGASGLTQPAASKSAGTSKERGFVDISILQKRIAYHGREIGDKVNRVPRRSLRERTQNLTLARCPLAGLPRPVRAHHLVARHPHGTRGDRIDRRQEPHVEVRGGRVPRVPAPAEQIAAVQAIADVNGDRVGRQVAKLGVLASGVLEDDVVPLVT